MAWSKKDLFFMRRCLLLANKGAGRVSPNPLVGAVLVREGKIIGEGFHTRFGAPHAEIEAMRGNDCTGATLYVSLEPCSHSSNEKKTPPCAPGIAASGIRRVLVATADPNPAVNGRGISLLRKAGIETSVGLLAKEAEGLNAPFFKFMRARKPYAVLKMAQSSDGRIGVRGKGQVKISGRKFDSYAQQLRNRCDAILVGIGAVLSDDPRLTCRMRGGRNPARIILDSNLSIPLPARVLQNAKREKVIIATSEKHSRAKAAKLRKMGASVFVCGKGKPSLRRLFSILPSQGIISVLIEGGAGIAKAALSQKLVDKAIVCVSEMRLGSKCAVASPIDKKFLLRLKMRKMGKDTIYEGAPTT